ncbi:MAG: DUF1232 domain-containing protein, partial [Clostridium sp.]|nr:DUF1232 domain-containing protein [Clostridium sp.]
MNISSVKVSLTGEDLLSIFNEFVKVEGLTLTKVDVDEEIKFYGSFSKGITLDFVAGIRLARIENGIIHGEVSSFKIAKIKIFSLMRKAALKFALKELSDMGIGYDSGKVVINLKVLLKDVPYVDLNISDIYTRQELLNIEVSDINISLLGTLIKEQPVEETEEEEETEEDFSDIEKVRDYYSVGRDYLEEKLPQKVKTFSDYVFIIPDMAALLFRLLKDKRVPMKTKIIISAAIAYIGFPTDIIPDNIPFIG